MKIFSIAILLLTISSGCSFESKQLNAISALLKSPDKEIPAPNWILYWYGNENPIYAINNEESIIFANDQNQVLVFKNNQISRILGILPNGSEVRIDRENDSLSYFENNIHIRTDECSIWYSSTKQSNILNRSVQNCFFKNTSSYQNTILFEHSDNEEKKIVGLKYKIHPQYPHVTIKMTNYLEEEF